MRREEKQSVILTAGQARAIVALQFEREEILRRVNEQLAQIGEAQEQGNLLALLHQLPRGGGWTYSFESVDVDGKPAVKLTAVPKLQEPEILPEPEEPADADEEQDDGN